MKLSAVSFSILADFLNVANASNVNYSEEVAGIEYAPRQLSTDKNEYESCNSSISSKGLWINESRRPSENQNLAFEESENKKDDQLSSEKERRAAQMEKRAAKKEKRAAKKRKALKKKVALPHYASCRIPSSLVFFGTKHLKTITKVFKSPLVFISIFELKTLVITKASPKIIFGIRFNSEEIAQMENMSLKELVPFITCVKDEFALRTGKPLQYCFDNLGFNLGRNIMAQIICLIRAEQFNEAQATSVPNAFYSVDTNNISELSQALNHAKSLKVGSRGSIKLPEDPIRLDHESIKSTYSSPSSSSSSSSSDS